MRRYGPRVARYALAGVILLWVTFSELGVLVFAYGVLESIIPWIPALPANSVAAMVTTPTFLAVGTAVFLTTAILGRQRYGSLAGFTVAVAKQVDSFLGWTLFDGPVLVGRITHNDVAWRFKYFEDGHIETVHRECLFCGLELVESVLRREIVHKPNSGFDPGEENREIAETAWADVFGQEKTEDHGEMLALTCPQCNFSVPGNADVLEGQDGALAKFRHHVNRMRSGNRRNKPFAEYVEAARAQIDGEPSPSDIWDAYVRSIEAEDALPIAPGVGTTAESGSKSNADELTSDMQTETEVTS